MSTLPTITSAQFVAALKIGASFNFKTAITNFESQSVQGKIVDGFMTIDEAAKLFGVICPAEAVVLNDIEAGVEIGEIVEPLIEPYVAPLVSEFAHDVGHFFAGLAAKIPAPSAPLDPIDLSQNANGG